MLFWKFNIFRIVLCRSSRSQVFKLRSSEKILQNSQEDTSTEYFWVFGVFLFRILQHSDWIRRGIVGMRENTDQKNSECGHFLRSGSLAAYNLLKGKRLWYTCFPINLDSSSRTPPGEGFYLCQTNMEMWFYKEVCLGPSFIVSDMILNTPLVYSSLQDKYKNTLVSPGIFS